MENIFQADQLTIDRSVLERSNPVFNTAKMTLFELGASGHEDAAAIAEKLGLTQDEAMNSKSNKMSDDHVLCGKIMMETRYFTAENIAKKSGCDTIVDLPCGYTPRALHLAQEERNYVGLDLPVTIEEAEPVIMSMIDEEHRKYVSFKSVDATNYESLRDALKDVEGTICICTEGLLMYFTDSEAGILCENVRRLLEEHGGCWIMADPENGIQFVLTMREICGDRFMEEMLKSKKMTEEKSDVNIGGCTLIINPVAATPDYFKKAMVFLGRHGLKAERLPIGENMPDLKVFSTVPEEMSSSIRKAMNNCAYWKVTLANSSKPLDTSDTKSQTFDVEASMDGDVLRLKLLGRLDTITAPDLLAFYEKTAAESSIQKVEVDCSKLDYISSAGLRILLIMHRGSKEGVTLSHVNYPVMEILQQTGFDSILNLET